MSARNIRAKSVENHSLLLILVLAVILLVTASVSAQDSIPDAPNPPRLVNDFAGVLQADQNQQLESKLVAFNDSTGVQIAVVTVASLAGYEKADFAQRLGQKWGVGGKQFNNGFIVLVKPKTDLENGQVFIATGYGVESLVTDANASDIVNQRMIPFFKAGDYYGGIDAATTDLMKFVKGEFKASTYGKSNGGSISTLIIIILIILLVIWISRNNNRHHTISRGGSSGPIFFPWIGSGSSSSGSGWGGFGGGGGGGGFGGFGGGSFGGGGAGGSW